MNDQDQEQQEDRELKRFMRQRKLQSVAPMAPVVPAQDDATKIRRAGELRREIEIDLRGLSDKWPELFDLAVSVPRTKAKSIRSDIEIVGKKTGWDELRKFPGRSLGHGIFETEETTFRKSASPVLSKIAELEQVDLSISPEYGELARQQELGTQMKAVEALERITARLKEPDLGPVERRQLEEEEFEAKRFAPPWLQAKILQLKARSQNEKAPPEVTVPEGGPVPPDYMGPPAPPEEKEPPHPTAQMPLNELLEQRLMEYLSDAPGDSPEQMTEKGARAMGLDEADVREQIFVHRKAGGDTPSALEEIARFLLYAVTLGPKQALMVQQQERAYRMKQEEEEKGEPMSRYESEMLRMRGEEAGERRRRGRAELALRASQEMWRQRQPSGAKKTPEQVAADQAVALLNKDWQANENELRNNLGLTAAEKTVIKAKQREIVSKMTAIKGQAYGFEFK